MTEQTNKASLYRKMAAIAGEIEAVEKDGKNKDQGYTYATPASVFRAIKPLLARHKVAIVPMQSGRQEIDTGRQSRGGNPYILCVADMTYLILDGESGESITATWSGVAGTYGDDKGNAKAQTISLRTFLIQLFQIPAEDLDHDPDARDPRETEQRRGAAYTPPAPAQPQTNGASGKASQKQISMLFAVWKSAAYEGTLQEWVSHNYEGRKVNELTISEASEAIETLQPKATT